MAIKDIYFFTNNSTTLLIEIKQPNKDDAVARYALRFGNLPANPQITSDLLFATLLKHTEGVFI